MVTYTWTLMIEKRDAHQVPGDGLIVYDYPVLGATKDQIDKYYSTYGDNAANLKIDTALGINYHNQNPSYPDINKIMSITYDRPSNLFRIIMSEPLSDVGLVFSIDIEYPDAEEGFRYASERTAYIFRS